MQMQMQMTDEEGLVKTLNDIEKAIAKGKKKKAKKLLKELEDAGHRGSVIKDLKKQVKGL